jgi:N-acetyl-1-D-myo-inositol-2-amino-2-deoxy-alpha-D-glucopyranoside deacetylase
VAHHAHEAPSLTGRTVLGVFAHPDDEALACGGTLARLTDGGATTVLVCATRGERGFVGEPTLVPDGDLGRVRTGELRAAAQVLGVSDVVVLDYPDGYLRWRDTAELEVEIVAAIQRYGPDAVITFDEDGLYWHGDHISIHERTAAAVSSLGADAPALYYVTMRRGVMRHVIDSAVARGWSRPAGGFWGLVPDAFGLHAMTPTLGLDVGDWVPRKLAALGCHRTQMGSISPFSLLEEAEARQWLGVEYFRRAPIGGSRSDILEQLGQPVVGASEG